MKRIILSLCLLLFTSTIFAEEYRVTAYKNLIPPIQPNNEEFYLVIDPQVDRKTTTIEWETQGEIVKWSWENTNRKTYIRIKNGVKVPFSIIINDKKIAIKKINELH